MENLYEVLSKDPTHTRPACSVRKGLVVLVGTSKVIDALEAVLERGT